MNLTDLDGGASWPVVWLLALAAALDPATWPGASLLELTAAPDTDGLPWAPCRCCAAFRSGAKRQTPTTLLLFAALATPDPLAGLSLDGAPGAHDPGPWPATMC